MPLPMMRKSERSSKPLLMLLSYHPKRPMRSRQPRKDPEPLRLPVRTSSGSYTIEIATGIAGRVRATLDALGVPARRFIVSSQTVWRFHGSELQSAADEEAILIPDGERYKQLATVGRIY